MTPSTAAPIAIPRPRPCAAALAVVLFVAILSPASAVHAAVPAGSSAEQLIEQVMLAPAGIQREESRPSPEEIPSPPPPPATASRAVEGPLPFAEVDGTVLMVPGEVRAVGFHEGAQGAVQLTPTGKLDEALNAVRSAPESTGESVVSYLVLPTRNRGVGAATAADISMVEGEPVLSVVSGTVKAVHDYQLYGRTPDQIVEIVPEGRPDQLVRMLHVEDVVVEEGDKVEGGETQIAESGRQLPFPSQIDRFAGRHPHVHVEMVQQ